MVFFGMGKGPGCWEDDPFLRILAHSGRFVVFRGFGQEGFRVECAERRETKKMAILGVFETFKVMLQDVVFVRFFPK